MQQMRNRIGLSSATHRLFSWLVGIGITLPVAACTSSSSGDHSSGDAGLAACGAKSAATCPPANGAVQNDFVYGLDALPTGTSCSSGSEPCSMLIDPCPDYPAHGAERADVYACECDNGSWVCGLCAMGGGICIIDDAGATQ